MKQLYTLLILLLLSPSSRAQAGSFPRSWEGNWKGELSSTTSGSSSRVPLSLHIQPIDSTRWTWTLQYEAPGQEPRAYQLVKSPAGWQIDEQNGIVLPLQPIGQRMASSFSVEDNWLLCYYWLENDALHMEIHAVLRKNTTTGTPATQPPEVATHFVSTLQQATLHRKQPSTLKQ